MQNNLFLRRLIIVTDENKCAYDETFHRGVNIIRGQNSSGKSTILRFIFFVLGGTYQDFVPEALRCSHVVAEIETNGKILTLKRYLDKTEEGDRCKKDIPMYMYLGGIEDYKADHRPKYEKWHKYGYRSSSETRSFSNVLFQMMGLPEFKADSNITMHQILRLIYLDQESPLSSLFFFDQWDKELTRETVARLLMGLYDEELSQAKLEKEQVEKDIEIVIRKKKVAAELLEDPKTMSSQFLKGMIRGIEEEAVRISERVKELRELSPDEEIRYIEAPVVRELALPAENQTNLPVKARKEKENKVSFEFQRCQEEISTLRKEAGRIETKVNQLKAEIDDSVYFLDALRKKREAVERSIATRDYFDALNLDLCPVCLSELSPKEPGHCPVCDAPVESSKGENQALRIQLELDHQISESEALLKANKTELDNLKDKLRTKKRQLTAAQRQFDDAVRNVRSTRDEEIDHLLETKGYKDAEANQYRTLLEYAERYERFSKELSDLQLHLDRLTNYIKAEENRIEREQRDIDQSISENGVFMLNNDQERQQEFMHANDFKVNYKQNLAYISNQRIKLSASSAFYLKMAARFALLFASLQVDTMLYPRLLFSDNMEDKGMEEERAKNFQRMVVRRLQELETGNLNPETGTLEPNYQLIFATSNIADELNTPAYTIGEEYSQSNKSLKNI